MVTDDMRGLMAVAYDPSAVEDVFLDSPELFSPAGDSDRLRAALKGCVVGRVQVKSPEDPCWDAMMIASIAGPGKLMYGLAYALSPSGLLISDRDSMTPQAVSAWSGMARKGGRGKKKLDDVDPPHATPGTEDDCKLRPEEFLNYAYESEGWEAGTLQGMVAEHERLIKSVTRGGDASRADVERALSSAGFAYFQARYRAAS